ncbi:MAG TPA: PE domain-containing protein [Mycobacterium sp.]|nr:PE domain-containing protein [Mycobacterium sp.]
MSFLTTVTDELLAAQGQLEAINSNLAAQNAGAAGATTVIAPAAADSVSAQQAAIFSAYGTQYQTIAAEAQTIQEQYATTLGTSSGTYSATESANAVQAAADPASGNIFTFLAQLLGGPSNSLNGEPFSLSGNLANYLNIGGGNWASAGSDLLGLAGGGLLDTSGGSAAAAADLAGTTAPVPLGAGAGAGMAGMGMMPMAAGAGQASMVGKLSVPPSWAGTVAPATSSATAVETVGLTTAMPQAGAGGIVPGMPGMVSGARNSAGFGAPRYGVKPIVMPKPTAV